MRRVWLPAAGIALVVALTFVAPGAGGRSVDLPSSLSDQAFWGLVEEFSEPDGYFDSDNLVSNEDTFQTVIPALTRTVAPGGVYLGVGPEQNFAYVLAVDPGVSFIVDIRRGNLQLHLMYKALIELAADRVEFLARLFGRRAPPGLGPDSSVGELFAAFATAVPDAAWRDETLRAVIERLTRVHGFPLSDADVSGIGRIYATFAAGGPRLRFVSSRPGNWYPTYEDIQVSTDAQGVPRGFLASEEHYRRLRAVQTANAIVPVVGDFAGDTALRAIGAYARAHGATVAAFYTSNVERYLFRDGRWRAFMENVAALPLDGRSTVIRSCFDSCSGPSGSRAVTLLDSMADLVAAVRAGRVTSYPDVLLRSRRR